MAELHERYCELRRSRYTTSSVKEPECKISATKTKSKTFKNPYILEEEKAIYRIPLDVLQQLKPQDTIPPK